MIELHRPTDKEIWSALDVLSRAISWKARDKNTADPRGLSGIALANRGADSALRASMQLAGTIRMVFKEYD